MSRETKSTGWREAVIKPPPVPITEELIESYEDRKKRAELAEEKRIMDTCRDIVDMRWKRHKQLEDTTHEIESRINQLYAVSYPSSGARSGRVRRIRRKNQ